MASTPQLAATVVERADDGCLPLGPEVDIATRVFTVEEARTNLQEAFELPFRAADQS